MLKNTILTLLLSILLPIMASGSHIVGSDLSYRFVSRTGNMNTFAFTLKLYRDCYSGSSGAQLPTSIGVSTFIGANSSWKVYRLNNANTVTVPISGGITRVNPPVYPCLTPPTDVCVDQGLYEWQETLQDTSLNYVITYQVCCRNYTISNIISTSASMTGSTSSIAISPEAQHSGNSSPIFNTFPPTVICQNEPLHTFNSATDVDGDQLVYEFCSPLDSRGTNVTTGAPCSYTAGGTAVACAPPYTNVQFVPPYSPTSPMGGSPVIRIDRNTGEITGTPTVSGQFVVGVCVKEYRNGVQIGQFFRDFQFNIRSCTRDVSSIIIADSSLSTPRGRSYFINTCDTTSIQFRNGSTVRANITNQRWEFYIRGDTIVSTAWEPFISFQDTGTYRGRLILNPGTSCGDTSALTVKIGAVGIKPNFGYRYDTCNAGPIVFRDSTVANPLNPVVKTIWSWGDGTSDTNRINPSHQYAVPGLKTVKVSMIDRFGCKSDSTRTIDWEPAPPILIVQPSSFVGCRPGKVSFVNRSTPIDSTYRIRWSFGDGGTDTTISPTYTYKDSGVYSVKLQIVSPLNCYREQIFRNWIKISPVPNADFEWQEKNVTNLDPTVHFKDKSIGDPTSWFWRLGATGHLNGPNPSYVFRDTGFQKVKLYISNKYGCRDSIFKEVYVKPEIRFFMPNAFTPNNDGLNDEFKGSGFLYGFRSFNLTVWNRWGELIFSTTNPEDGWNGKKNNIGEYAPDGIYLYEVNLIGPHGEPTIIRDVVTLYR
jgi:gliding motility-associated-like protein